MAKKKKKKATKTKAKSRKTKAKKKTAKKKTKKKATKTKAKKTAKRTASKKKTKKKGTRRPNAAFMKPLNPSEVLASIVGNKPLPRTEVTKRLWTYIKKNKLQDAVERRFINADQKLKQLFGGKSRVSMFEMTKHVSKHLS